MYSEINRERKFNMFAAIRSNKKRQCLELFAFAIVFYVVFIVLGCIILPHMFSSKADFDFSNKSDVTKFSVIIGFVFFFFVISTIFLTIYIFRQRYFKRIFEIGVMCPAKLLKVSIWTKEILDKTEKLSSYYHVKIYELNYAVIIGGKQQIASTTEFTRSKKLAKQFEEVRYFNVWYSKELNDTLYLKLKYASENINPENFKLLNEPIERKPKSKKAKTDEEDIEVEFYAKGDRK